MLRQKRGENEEWRKNDKLMEGADIKRWFHEDEGVGERGKTKKMKELS